MSNPNPYEPPREPDPLTTGKVVKRGLGVGTILILTPIAVAIAFGASCGVGLALDSPGVLPDTGTGIALLLGAIFLPPIAVFIGMVWWASATYRRSVLPAKKKSIP